MASPVNSQLTFCNPPICCGLRIKVYYVTSENAVKTKISITVSFYLLVTIVKKLLGLPGSLYTLLQVLSVTLFEKMPISQPLQQKTT